MVRKRRKTVFFKPKSKRLAKAISIKTPAEFRKSIAKVKRLRGISALRKKRALVLARTRAKLQLKRRNLSLKERREFRAIARMKIPKVI